MEDPYLTRGYHAHDRRVARAVVEQARGEVSAARSRDRQGRGDRIAGVSIKEDVEHPVRPGVDVDEPPGLVQPGARERLPDRQVRPESPGLENVDGLAVGAEDAVRGVDRESAGIRCSPRLASW